MSKKIFIVDGVRLPVGTFTGFYKGMKAQDLGAIAIEALVSKTNIDKSIIDEVIVGNVIQTDEKGNPGREAALKAGIPVEIPAFTLNKNCASGAKAITLGASAIKAGDADVIVAVGMESMSDVPYLLRKARYGYRMGDNSLSDLLTDLLLGMGMTAERLAEKYKITREEQDRFAFLSQQKASKAIRENVFKDQIFPVTIATKKAELTIENDEGVKGDTTLEALSKLKPVFKSDGTVTAGNSSTINDGASALLLISEDKLNELGLEPMAEIISYASAGCDPDIMGIGPVPATLKALKKAELAVDDIDVFELNEAFAAQALACIKELNIDPEKVNPNGSGISLGHPVGATGAILTTKMIYHLRDTNKKYGVITMCIGGGQGLSIVVKNCKL